MAESSGTVEQTRVEAERQSLKLLSYDGKKEITVQLEVDKDAAHPPHLVDISTRELESSTNDTTTPSIAQYETHIILSTGSGHRKATSFYQEVVQPILNALDPSNQDNWNLHTTQSETSILELIDQELFPKANKGTKLRIILASGDGGVVDLVNGLSSKPSSSEYCAPQIILLPLGTANALYHSINSGKQEKNTWGLHALSSTDAKPLSTFKASFSPGARLLVDEARSEEALLTDANGHGILYGAVVCSWGMHASLVADSDTAEYRKYGIQRFKMAAKEALQPSDGSAPHVYRARVSVLNGETWTDIQEKELLYLLATMVSHLEAPLCISPATGPLDGSLRLVRFGPKTGEEVMRIMGLAYQGGKHVDEEDVGYEAIDGLRIAFSGMEKDGKWRRICVDGKIVRVEKDGWVEVRKEKRSVADIVV